MKRMNKTTDGSNRYHVMMTMVGGGSHLLGNDPRCLDETRLDMASRLGWVRGLRWGKSGLAALDWLFFGLYGGSKFFSCYR